MIEEINKVCNCCFVIYISDAKTAKQRKSAI